jgi:hypothetical protein
MPSTRATTRRSEQMEDICVLVGLKEAEDEGRV